MSRRHKHDEHARPAAPTPDPVVAEGEVLLGAAEPDATAGDGVATVENAEAALRRELEDWKDKYLRARAEMQNAARRAANERDEALRYANAGLLRDLLEVVDDFDRALAAAAQADSAAGVIDGVKLVQEKLAKFLRHQQVEVIEAQGAPFDPTQHEALLQQPTQDVAPGIVLQQVQRGYRLRDRVLRPAKVIVAAAPAQAAEQGE